MKNTPKDKTVWVRTRYLAEKASITPANVSEFVDLITSIWNSDPERAHEHEYKIRSRVIKMIAAQKLQDAAGVCKQLELLRRDDLTRWFA